MVPAAAIPLHVSPPFPGHEAAPRPGAQEVARFDAMVSGDPGSSNFGGMPSTGDATPIAKIIHLQADLFKGHVDALRQAKASMSLGASEVTAANINLTLSAAASHMNFVACTSVAQSVKNAAQTLLKNQ